MKHASIVVRGLRATFGSASFWLGLLPSMGLLGGLYLALAAEEPINLNSVSAAGAAVQGRALSLDLRADVAADCEGKVERWAVRWIGTDSSGRRVGDWRPFAPAGNPLVGVGDGLRWRITLPLPATLEPGAWFYVSRTVDGCRWGSRLAAALFGPPRRYSPLVPFTVVEPGADTPPAVVPAIGPVVVVPER